PLPPTHFPASSSPCPNSTWMTNVVNAQLSRDVWYLRPVETVFLEATGDRHTRVVGGLTALERRIREVAKQGAQKAVVAAEPVAIARPLPIPVEYVAPGSAVPDGAKRERADVIAGVELVD